MGLSQVWSSLINFALKSSPAKLVGSLEQKLYSNSGFFNYFFFNIGCSHPISCLLFSLQSDLEPHFFMWFFFFSTPVSSSNETPPFSYTFYTPARPSSLPGCLGPGRGQETLSSLLGLMPLSSVSWKVPSELPRPWLEHTQHKPVSPGKLAVKS